MSGGTEPDAGRTAGFTALFIRRPIFALVVNTLIIVAGLAALNGIEVRELPQVDQPVVSVTTTFDGASPETVDREADLGDRGRGVARPGHQDRSPRPRNMRRAA